MWETFTLGGTPYPGLPTEQLLDYLSEGKRMDNPAKCPLEVYTVMRDCWLHDPEQRPHFATLNERLGKILERHMTTVKTAVTYFYFMTCIFYWRLFLKKVSKDLNSSRSLCHTPSLMLFRFFSRLVWRTTRDKLFLAVFHPVMQGPSS